MASDEVVEVFDSSPGKGNGKRAAILKLAYSVGIVVEFLTLQSSPREVKMKKGLGNLMATTTLHHRVSQSYTCSSTIAQPDMIKAQ